MSAQEKELFVQLKESLLSIDPVYWCQKYLTLDGRPFRINGNGFKPFSDVYRYIGVRALNQESKPVILVKGRQVGGTVMAAALEMYFMGSGLFGTNGKAPIRVIHAFPQREHAEKFSKEKLNPMINTSVSTGQTDNKKNTKSCMQSMIDMSSDSNNSLHFKQFMGGNFLRIDSTGLAGDRLRGGTADVIFFDECFPFNQNIEIYGGKKKIGCLYNDFINGKQLPLVKTFNEFTEQFEYKEIVNAWKREPKDIIQITCGNKEIKCTNNHKFLTHDGWKETNQLKIGDLIKTSNGTNLHIRALGDDQMQIILGSFLGDGHLSSYKIGRYRLTETHGIKQAQYCEWKSSILGGSLTMLDKNSYLQKPAIKFSTKTFGLSNQLPSNKKYCPQWVLDKIDARGIAVWFMDDGSRNTWNSGSAGYLSTCSFDEDSQVRIVNKFKSLGIECHYASYKHKNTDKEYYSIYFNKDAFKKLCILMAPYFHESMYYKLNSMSQNQYKWSSDLKKYGFTIVDRITYLNKQEVVYDIEIKDNHNFILAPSHASKNMGGPIAHNCQDITGEAIGNTVEMLKQAKYGRSPGGVQVYFGTPKKKGSDFYKMWAVSSQQYYHLGCEKCKQYFPLYTPESDEWKKIWIHGFTVKCPHCDHEQDKRIAAEKGKWVSSKDPNDSDCRFIGFHINQFYMPNIKREDIEAEMPGNHPTNTERKFKNEVLGEFFQGDSSPITTEEIIEKCGERERKMRSKIESSENQMVFLGIDYGLKSDLEQLAYPEKRASQGQSYTTAVVLSVKGPNLFSVDFALKFSRNDPESKKGIIDNIMRQYSVNMAIGDIGYSNDFSYELHTKYGDRYMVSRAHPKVNDKQKFNMESYPKEIVFEKDHYIAEAIELLKKGQIKFPLGSYDSISWLIEHCSSMEMKPSMSRYGDPEIHYVKGGSPNDGFAALINAYIAYKFTITQGFRIKNPNLMKTIDPSKSKPLIMIGHVKRLL